MPVSFADFEIQENVFSTNEFKKVFDESARIQRWLDVEVALAATQAELGHMPHAAAQTIKANSKLMSLDLNSLKNEYKKSRNSLIPVLKVFKKACGEEVGKYIHVGATTQDIIDTGQMLAIKKVFAMVYRDLRKVELLLLNLAQLHANTVMIGRTHGQHALPITFGYKAAVWLLEVRRHIERLKSLRNRTLVGQLSGAVGTMAAWNGEGHIIAKKTLARLGLDYAAVPWHVSRDNIAEIAAFFSIAVQTSAKIANEIFQLCKTDVQEIQEKMIVPGAKSSSAMPHKFNPVLSQQIVVISKHARSLSDLVVEAMLHEHERDPRALWSEWLSVPQLCIYTGSALSKLIELLETIEISAEQMQLNLHKYGQYAATEHLLTKLSPKLGKVQAEKLLHSIIDEAHLKKISIKTLIKANPVLCRCLQKEDIEILDHPERYAGDAERIVYAAVKQVKVCREQEPALLFIEENKLTKQGEVS